MTDAELPVAIDAINRGNVFRFVVKPWDDPAFKQIVMEGIKRFQVVRLLKETEPGLINV